MNTESIPEPMAKEKARAVALGQSIRLERKKVGLTLQQLADKAGTVKSHLWDIEHGNILGPSVFLIKAISLYTSARVYHDAVRVGK